MVNYICLQNEGSLSLSILIQIITCAMKVYLSDSHPHYASNKGELERIKSKLIKNASKSKNPQVHLSNKTTNVHSSVSNRSKSSKKQEGQQIIVKMYKQHVRTHTDSEVHLKSEQSKGQNQLNRTCSKHRLKTETSNCNGETVRAVKKEKKQIESEDNFIAGIVKERLNQEKRNKRDITPSIRTIIDLATLTKQRQREQKANGIELSTAFGNVYHQMQREELTQRQYALCELVQVLMKKEGGQYLGREERLLRVVRELQQRNVRLMNLVNYMKQQGVDVDSFWNTSNLP